MNKLGARIGGGSLLVLAVLFAVLSLGLPAHFAFVDRDEIRLAHLRTEQPSEATDPTDIASQLARITREPDNLLDLASQQLARELTGPAEWTLQAAASTQLEPAAVNERRNRLNERLAANPALRTSGGTAPYFDALEKLLPLKPDPATGQNVLPLLAPEANRDVTRNFLQRSASPAVAAILQTRAMSGTTRFFPATNPGGAPLDATILTTALLLQGEHFGSANPDLILQLTELANLATADDPGAVAALEQVYQGILRLGRFMNWRQLTEVARLATDLSHLPRLAQLARERPENSALLFGALMLCRNTESLLEYLEAYGDDTGWDDLRFATGQGRAALDLLLERQQPIYHPPGWLAPLSGYAPENVTRFCLRHPPQALFLKGLGFLAAGICLTFGVTCLLSSSLPREWTAFHPLDLARHALLASVVLVSLIALSEPSLFAESAELPSRISIDFGPLAQAVDIPNTVDRSSMPDQITLLMLGIFFVLQVCLYLICLIRVGHIRKLEAPAGLKMSLLENEEVLFDSGLYVGLGGTVASLIMVATSLVQAGLMAAYASTLFGILFVAVLKIFHVRPYKRNLLYELQGGN
ncbi:MAG: hypothetical protein ACFBZ8_06680 [Opitutales bacterium]